VTADGTTAKLYFDGLDVTTSSVIGALVANTNALTLGRRPGGSSPMTGLIDDVRVYNCGLSHGEIAVLAGLEGTIYVPLDLPTNLVPKDPCDSEDPNLGTGAFDPNNMDIINFLDYRIMARDWLKEVLWPVP